MAADWLTSSSLIGVAIRRSSTSTSERYKRYELSPSFATQRPKPALKRDSKASAPATSMNAGIPHDMTEGRRSYGSQKPLANRHAAVTTRTAPVRLGTTHPRRNATASHAPATNSTSSELVASRPVAVDGASQ